MYCPYCGANVPEHLARCSSCGADLNAPQSPEAYAAAPAHLAERPMKWFHFLIYFALWASAVVNLVNGFPLLTGSAYGESTEFLYALSPALHVLTVLIGLLSIGIAVLCIYSRFRLAGFYRNGPASLYAVYLCNLAIGILFPLGAMICLSGLGGDLSFLTPTIISAVISSVVMLLVNRSYFKKRAHLFIR